MCVFKWWYGYTEQYNYLKQPWQPVLSNSLNTEKGACKAAFTFLQKGVPKMGQTPTNCRDFYHCKYYGVTC